MKFYVEILHPYKQEVLWHYYMVAPSEETAREAASNKFIEEQSNNLLLDTGGLFIITVTEEK